MNTLRALTTLSTLTFLGGTALLAAPRPQDPSPEPLAPREERSVASDAPQQAFDAAGWKSRLSSPDLRERLGAFDALVELAGMNEGARAALAEWAQDQTAPELAWTALLAQRELERGAAADRFPGRDPRFPGLRGDVFTDPFAGFGGRGSLDALFDELRAEMDALRRGAFSTPRALPGLPPGSFQSSHGFRFEQTPEGVKVEITEQVDGQDVTRTYEAKTIEELLSTHPELEQHLQVAPDMAFPGLPRSRPSPFGQVDPQDDFLTRPPIPRPLGPDPLAPRTDRLGVQVREPASDGEVGLHVVEVLPGSLAELLGVRAGDVLSKLNGTEVRSVDDVRNALAARPADEPIVLEVLGPDGRASTLTWRPEGAAQQVKPGRQA